MRNILILSCLFIVSGATAQQQHIIFFESKDNAEVAYYQAHPEAVFSEAAIARRASRNISMDAYDVPVSNHDIRTFTEAGWLVVGRSRWLNAIVIQGDGTLTRPYRNVREIQTLPAPNPGRVNKHTAPIAYGKTQAIDYGLAVTQNQLLGIEYLHDKGYSGAGITIAVLDVGFQSTDTSSFFDSVHADNRIIATRDFWDYAPEVYHKGSHGTYVMSIIAANQPGMMVGMAPNVDLLLAITDDFFTETHSDEFKWVEAAEWADSMGADIISSSVSYSVFDSGQGDYDYSDMDGKTSIIAKGANMAASRGLIVINSAGNSGKITTPCDADSVLCVGGVDDSLRYDLISSTGPSFDGRVKPDVSAMTREVWGVNETGLNYYWYGGTSGATPMISGLAACLLQAHPNRTNMEIISSIRQTAHLYPNPDTAIGYGVPNARIADSLLTILDGPSGLDASSSADDRFRVYPNPFRDQVTIEGKEGAAIQSADLYSIHGQHMGTFKPRDEKLVIPAHRLPRQPSLLRITARDGSRSVVRLIRM